MRPPLGVFLTTDRVVVTVQWFFIDTERVALFTRQIGHSVAARGGHLQEPPGDRVPDVGRYAGRQRDAFAPAGPRRATAPGLVVTGRLAVPRRGRRRRRGVLGRPGFRSCLRTGREYPTRQRQTLVGRCLVPDLGHGDHFRRGTARTLTAARPSIRSRHSPRHRAAAR